ncbi:MAG: family 10 glycosylhydrolase, partial [bacterium]
MKKIFISGLIIFTLSTFCAKKTFVVYQKMPTSPISELPNELRGLWITRFDWSHPNPDSMRARIIAIMKNTADLNYNTIFFQVRGQAETLYPSPLESWSKLLNYTDPGFDPVQFAIEQARNNNLVFYAYINLLPLWNEETPPDHQNHLYHQHGPKVHPDSSWVCFEPGGIPMNLNEYYYLNPALPQVKNYLKHVIRHFVENYDVDGIHFDRIRYPGQNYVSDPYSLQKFRTDSLENRVTRSEWARQQLTDLVEN